MGRYFQVRIEDNGTVTQTTYHGFDGHQSGARFMIKAHEKTFFSDSNNDKTLEEVLRYLNDTYGRQKWLDLNAIKFTAI